LPCIGSASPELGAAGLLLQAYSTCHNSEAPFIRMCSRPLPPKEREIVFGDLLLARFPRINCCSYVTFILVKKGHLSATVVIEWLTLCVCVCGVYVCVCVVYVCVCVVCMCVCGWCVCVVCMFVCVCSVCVMPTDGVMGVCVFFRNYEGYLG